MAECSGAGASNHSEHDTERRRGDFMHGDNIGSDKSLGGAEVRERLGLREGFHGDVVCESGLSAEEPYRHRLTGVWGIRFKESTGERRAEKGLSTTKELR